MNSLETRKIINFLLFFKLCKNAEISRFSIKLLLSKQYYCFLLQVYKHFTFSLQNDILAGSGNVSSVKSPFKELT